MKTFAITINVNDLSFRMTRDGLEEWDAELCDWVPARETDVSFIAFNALERLEVELNG